MDFLIYFILVIVLIFRMILEERWSIMSIFNLYKKQGLNSIIFIKIKKKFKFLSRLE